MWPSGERLKEILVIHRLVHCPSTKFKLLSKNGVMRLSVPIKLALMSWKFMQLTVILYINFSRLMPIAEMINMVGQKKTE